MLSHVWIFPDQRNFDFVEEVTWPNSAYLKQMRGVKSSASEDHFLTCSQFLCFACGAVQIHHANGCRSIIKQNFGDRSIEDNSWLPFIVLKIASVTASPSGLGCPVFAGGFCSVVIFICSVLELLKSTAAGTGIQGAIVIAGISSPWHVLVFTNSLHRLRECSKHFFQKRIDLHWTSFSMPVFTIIGCYITRLFCVVMAVVVFALLVVRQQIIMFPSFWPKL